MILTYLGTLDNVYSSPRPQIIWSFVVSSQLETSFLKNVIPAVSPDRWICPSSSGEANWDMRGLHWWTFWWPRWYQGRMRKSSRGTRRWLYNLLLLLQRTRPYEVSVPILKGKPGDVHIFLSLFQMMSSCDVNLSSSRCFSTNVTYKLRLPLSLTLAQKKHSYILSYIVDVTYLNYKFRSNLSHDWKSRKCVFFYSSLNL